MSYNITAEPITCCDGQWSGETTTWTITYGCDDASGGEDS